jgi:predicted chitinase
MAMLTAEQLHAIMPALPASKSAALFPFLAAAIDEFAIATPARIAAFLAQLAHESAQFRFMEEIWGPTAAQRRYEPPSTLAANLGNTESGDGFRFKGRGPIQITGRANYRRFGDLLGLDLVAEPTRASRPDVAFRIAGLFWSKKGLNDLADERTDDAFREITRRINGGFNGLPDRQRFYAVARTVLGVGTAPVTRGGAASVRPRGTEPEFDRGSESIRADVPAKPPRKIRTRKTQTKRARKTSGRKMQAQTTRKAPGRRTPAQRTGKVTKRKTTRPRASKVTARKASATRARKSSPRRATTSRRRKP